MEYPELPTRHCNERAVAARKSVAVQSQAKVSSSAGRRPDRPRGCPDLFDRSARHSSGTGEALREGHGAAERGDEDAEESSTFTAAGSREGSFGGGVGVASSGWEVPAGYDFMSIKDVMTSYSTRSLTGTATLHLTSMAHSSPARHAYDDVSGEGVRCSSITCLPSSDNLKYVRVVSCPGSEEGLATRT